MDKISETKTPKAGEWWVRNTGGRYFFIVGFTPEGSVVHYNENVGLFSSKMRFFCKDFYHEPRCTGFGWVEPPAEDPNDMPLNPVPGKVVATGTVTLTPVTPTACVACGVNWALDGSVSCRECYEHAIVTATGCTVESPDDMAAIIAEHTQQVRELTQRIGELARQVNERDRVFEKIRTALHQGYFL